MATKIREEERDGKLIAVYDNGMERDVGRGRITKPPQTSLITKENTSEFHRARLEKKHERVLAGANKALEKLPGWENPQDLDVIEAIAESQATQALGGEEAYRTKAAEFVYAHAGLSEKQAQEPELPSDERDILHYLAERVRAVQKAGLPTDAVAEDVA